jgi:hypothetical protein
VIAAVELAGYFTAHAVWCVSEGATLVPILAFETGEGSRQMHRLFDEDLEQAVARGRGWLKENPESASRAALIYDGYIHLPDGKTDALMVEVRELASGRSVTLAVPYRHAESPKGFAVHRPKFLGFEGEQPDFDEVAEAFFRGVDQHEQGAAVWNSHLDESR